MPRRPAAPAKPVAKEAQIIELEVHAQSPTLGDEDCAELAEALRNGELVDDVRFDRVYEGRWREPSKIHWTPIRIVRRVAALLELKPTDTVLDVGSGVGKFCLLGALLSPARFVGVEHRAALVKVSDAARKRLRIENARFIEGDALGIDWAEFSCVYLYNPFDENLMPEALRIDAAVPLSGPTFVDSVELTKKKLEQLGPGTRVVTYFGVGDAMPACCQRLHTEPDGSGALEIWRRR